MKLGWRNWRVVFGAVGISVLIVVGSYFGSYWGYQLDDERLKPPPTISNVPTTPIDSHATARGTYSDSGPEIVTSEEEASFIDEAETWQATQGSIARLLVKKQKLDAAINQLNNQRHEIKNQRTRDYERLETELYAMERDTQKEVDRVSKILEAKFGPNPTLEECQSVEEWRQLGKLLRENDPVRAVEEREKSYSLKMKEIDQKEDKLFDERSAISARIEDLASQLAGE